MRSNFDRARAVAAAMAFVCIPAAGALGAVIWDESTQGDLPETYQFSSPASPDNTAMNFGVLAAGTHRLLGTNIQTSSGFSNRFEGDAVRFTVPAGLELGAILFDHDRAAGMREFLKVSGTSTLETHVFRNFPAMHMPIGVQDLIALPSINPGGAPLGPGEYLVSWDNSTFNTVMTYTMDLVLIPGPGAAGLMVVGGLVALRRRR